MKQNFLALVNEVKATGIVAILSNASNAEAFKDAWQKFADENPELLKKASEWGAEFKQTEAEPFFEEGEAVENPMEVVVAIRIAGNEVSEADVFENWNDLVNALKDLETSLADAVAECVDCTYIYNIEVEEIFTAIEEAEEDGDENGEEAEPDESDDDGEAEPENGEEEAECDEDSDADVAESEETEADDEDAQGAEADEVKPDEAKADDDDLDLISGT